jgi:hypothetical protein
VLLERSNGEVCLELLPELALLSTSYLRLHQQSNSPGDIGDAKSFLRQILFLIAKGATYSDPTSNAMLLNIVGELMLQMPNPDIQASKIMFNKYCTQLIEAYGEKHLASSDCYAVMAAFYCKFQDYGTALPYARKVLPHRDCAYARINCLVIVRF